MKSIEPRSVGNNPKNLPKQSKPLITGSTHRARTGWGWLLLIAPGRLLVVQSSLSPTEVERRLSQHPRYAILTQRHRVSIRLPAARTERRFFAWIEPNPAQPGSSFIIGQTRTPARTALIRAALSLTLFWLALFWFSSAHTWLGVIFATGCVSFLLLAQYERLTERDRRLYVSWLQEVIDAVPVEMSH